MSYIGAEPDGMGKAQRFTYTSASGGETVVSVDDNSVPIGYTSGQVSVFLNGVKLVVGTDCIATNGSTITGLSALAASDVVEVVALSIFSATTVEGADIISTGVTGTTKYLRVDGDGTSSWQTVTHTPEGTAVLSTGETGTSKFLRIDGDGTSSWQTVTEYNDNVIQTNIALLAFKTAVNGSLAKYSLQDQVIDEYTNATGIDATPSTNHILAGGAYSGSNPSGAAAGLSFRYLRITITNGTYHDVNAGLMVATFKDESAGTPTNGYTSAYAGNSLTSTTIANTLLNGTAHFAYTTASTNDQYVDLDFGSLYSGVTKLYMGKYRTNGDPLRISIATSPDDSTYTLVPSAAGVTAVSGMTFNATQGGTAFTFSHQGTGSFDMSAFGTNNQLGYSSIEGGSNWTHTGTVISDIILQSTDTTAEAAPTKADMVMLMEDSAGTATLNTDIKGYVSRDSGVSFTEGVLVDEGDWGTNKRILAFHDLSFTSSSGTAMCYKITTHNQALAKHTKIHATSIGWR
jgi:hypothetical protein